MEQSKIWLNNLELAMGAEIKKIRPVVGVNGNFFGTQMPFT